MSPFYSCRKRLRRAWSCFLNPSVRSGTRKKFTAPCAHQVGNAGITSRALPTGVAAPTATSRSPNTAWCWCRLLVHPPSPLPAKSSAVHPSDMGSQMGILSQQQYHKKDALCAACSQQSCPLALEAGLPVPALGTGQFRSALSPVAAQWWRFPNPHDLGNIPTTQSHLVD